MLEFDTKIKEWGNSFGLIIPKSKFDLNGFKKNEEVHVIVLKKSNVLRETFGMLKGRIKSGQEAKDLIRKELHSKII